MQKRRLKLDKELLTVPAAAPDTPEAGTANFCVITRKIVETILVTIGAGSAIEPPACDCLDTDSCSNACPGTDGCTNACPTPTCPPQTGSCACHTDQAGGPYC